MTLSRYTTRARPMRRWGLENDDVNDVFGQMERMMLQPLMQGMMSSRASGNGSNLYPIDLYETADNVVLEMAVPGVSTDHLDISLEGRQLTIHGVLPDGEDDAEQNEGRSYWVRGIPRGEFQRTVTVPSGVNADGIQAHVDQGLLTLTMPKASEAKARKIDIQAAGQGQRPAGQGQAG